MLSRNFWEWISAISTLRYEGLQMMFRLSTFSVKSLVMGTRMLKFHEFFCHFDIMLLLRFFLDQVFCLLLNNVRVWRIFSVKSTYNCQNFPICALKNTLKKNKFFEREFLQFAHCEVWRVTNVKISLNQLYVPMTYFASESKWVLSL